jgi:hypothetical protein
MILRLRSCALSLMLATLPALPAVPPPLAVAQVVREGLPPYEDADRRYRLEGDGAAQLRPGQVLLLVRPGEPRALGLLEVLSVAPDHAMARLSRAGPTFPMKGDRVVPREPLRTLPALPTPAPLPVAGLRPPAVPLLPEPAEPAPPPPPPAAPGPSGSDRQPDLSLIGPHRQPIFFLPAEAYLTPGARVKLRTWVQTWGRGGRWTLTLTGAESPDAPLAQARIRSLREELSRLGVAKVRVVTSEQTVDNPYPAVLVGCEAD